MIETTIFSKGVPNNCCINPKDQSPTKNQHITVIPLLYLDSLTLPTNNVKTSPIIEITVFITDIGSCSANDSDLPPLTHVNGILLLIIRKWIRIVKE
ncbi:hypothetical protein [Ureibacillus sp. GCM10028918]|uniref:hypothetical protein n=1 Tax=Ureibacillus sp. GCM10028918 TaxID=3273429 RepID=UPI00360AF40A